MRLDLLSALNGERKARRAAVLVTDLGDGNQRLVRAGEIALDRYPAIALLTHDPKIDDPALNLALKAECFYIGALGSKKTHAKRLERLAALGLGAQAARIHAPIGLDIGAVSPAEIAVSILGEIVLSLRKKPLRSEKDRAA